MTHGCVTATDMCANSTDCVGVLLLLLQLQFSQTKPIDFICDPEVRRRMDVTETLEPLMTHCLDQLPSDVLQPCVRINMGAWKQTSSSTLTPERDCEGHKTSSLTQTVRFYRKLLRGPVELLMKDLTHMCTTHT